MNALLPTLYIPSRSLAALQAVNAVNGKNRDSEGNLNTGCHHFVPQQQGAWNALQPRCLRAYLEDDLAIVSDFLHEYMVVMLVAEPDD